MLQFKEVLFCKFGVALIVGQRLFLCIYAKQSKGFVYIVAFVMAKGVFVKSKANCCVWLIQLWAKRGVALGVATKKPPKQILFERLWKLGAGTGFEPATFRL